MVGCLEPDQLEQSLSVDQFDLLDAWNRVLPLDHGPKMLGMIAYLLSGYMSSEDADYSSLRAECMPWLSDREISASDALTAIKRGDR